MIIKNEINTPGHVFLIKKIANCFFIFAPRVLLPMALIFSEMFWANNCLL